MTTRIGRISLLATLSLFCVLAMPVHAGDDDKPPAYKIYIDPETGKYTTEDPDAAAQSASTTRPMPAAAAENSSSGIPLMIAAAGVAVALLAGGYLRHQWRHN